MFFKLKKRTYFWFFVLLFLLLMLLPFQFRGMTYYDEGYILNSALRVANGQIPYKDFDIVYTPMSFVFTAVFLKLFGVSVFSERLGALFITIASLVALTLLLRLLTKNIILIVASLVFFVSWGPTHMNFAWPVMFSICFLLYAALFYLLGINHKSKKYFFLAGVMTILVFLSKQNFGAGVFLALLISFLFIPLKNKKEYVLQYLFGTIATAGVYLLILIATSSLLPFIQNMYLYTVKRVLIDNQLDTPFLYEGPIYARIAKFFFYTSPVIFSGLSFWLVFKKNKKLLFIPLLTAIFYFLGVRPTTDYVHVAPLIALSCLPYALFLIYVKKQRFKNLLIGVLILFIGLGFYTAYFKGYYQWEASMTAYNQYASNPRLRIYLTDVQIKAADDLRKYVQSRTKEDEFIFVNYYAPLVYVLTDRENPTPYDLISTNQLPTSYQKGMIETLKQKKVKLVMLHELNKDEDSIVSNYIRKEYPRQKTIGNFVVFEK